MGQKQIKKKLEKKVGAVLSEKMGLALNFLVQSQYVAKSDKGCSTTCSNCRHCQPRTNTERAKCRHINLGGGLFFFSTNDDATCKLWGSETGSL